MTVRLAVFDCDGTLVDSQANILAAMKECFANNRLDAPEDHATRRIVGLSLKEAMAALLPEGDSDLHAKLANDYKSCFQRLRSDSALVHEPLYPGALDTLERLEAAGWVLGMATGKSDRGLTHALAHHGIAKRFVTLQTADRHPSKPHPSMLRQAMRDAGAEADATLMIGDTVFDMAMAMNAGVHPIGVDWGYHDAEELSGAGARIVADDYAALAAYIEAL